MTAGDALTARRRTAAPRTRDPRIGAMLGDYFLAERIGLGGMATVYRAVDRGGTSVAVKVPLPGVARDPDLLERFVLEARALGLVRHRGVVGFIELGIAPDGIPFHVLEYVEGKTLAALVRERPLAAVHAGAIARELAHILAALHAMGVVHRDIKPSNVVVRRDGTLALLDFGIAKLARLGSELSHTGFALGTPGYMAPEQLEGRACDRRVDVFALGVLLRELATGEQPPLPRVTRRVASVPPPRAPSLPRWCAAIIRRATAPDRDARFACAHELARAIDAALATTPASGGDIVGSTPVLRAPDVPDEATLVDPPDAAFAACTVESRVPLVVRTPDGTRLAVERVRPVDRDHAARIRRDVEALATAGASIIAPRVLATTDDALDLGEPIGELAATRWLAEPRRPAHVAGVLADVATALAEAHARGIAHRDITPARIVVVEGRGRLGGFQVGHHDEHDDARRADVRALIAIAETRLPTARGLADHASAVGLAAGLRALARRW